MSNLPAQPSSAEVPASRPLVLAFATQKGGMGKTTLSVLVASWLHYRRGIKVALLDVDTSQTSVNHQRDREIDNLDEATENRFDKQGIAAFEIQVGSPADVPNLLKGLEPDTKLVLVDMPGSIDVAGYEVAIQALDYLIVPTDTSQYVVTSTFEYLSAIKQIDLLPVDRCRILWNRFKKSRDQEMADQLEEIFTGQGFITMAGRIPERDSYKSELNLSTLFPISRDYIRNTGTLDVLNEIESLILITNE